MKSYPEPKWLSRDSLFRMIRWVEEIQPLVRTKVATPYVRGIVDAMRGVYVCPYRGCPTAQASWTKGNLKAQSRLIGRYAIDPELPKVYRLIERRSNITDKSVRLLYRADNPCAGCPTGI